MKRRSFIGKASAILGSEGLCVHPERVAKHLARTDPLGVCPLHTISGIKETDMTRRHVLGGV